MCPLPCAQSMAVTGVPVSDSVRVPWHHDHLLETTPPGGTGARAEPLYWEVRERLSEHPWGWQTSQEPAVLALLLPTCKALRALLSLECPRGWGSQGLAALSPQSGDAWSQAGKMDTWHSGSTWGAGGRLSRVCRDRAERHQLLMFTEVEGTGWLKSHMWGGEGERSYFPCLSPLSGSLGQAEGEWGGHTKG